MSSTAGTYRYAFDYVKKAVDEIVYTKEQEYKKQEQMLVPGNDNNGKAPEAKP